MTITGSTSDSRKLEGSEVLTIRMVRMSVRIRRGRHRGEVVGKEVGQDCVRYVTTLLLLLLLLLCAHGPDRRRRISVRHDRLISGDVSIHVVLWAISGAVGRLVEGIRDREVRTVEIFAASKTQRGVFRRRACEQSTTVLDSPHEDQAICGC